MVQDSLNEENGAGIVTINTDPQIIAKNVLEEHSVSLESAVDSIQDPSVTVEGTPSVPKSVMEVVMKNGSVFAHDLEITVAAVCAASNGSTEYAAEPLPCGDSTVETRAVITIDPSHDENVILNVVATSDVIKDEESSSIITGMWNVLYDDGMEATLNEVTLR